MQKHTHIHKVDLCEMDGTQGGSASPAPFLTKTYELVDDRTTNPIVSWSRNGRSFVVWNPPEFARDLLPKYFKHNNFSSFIRQLNTYGFRKIDAEQWEFANEEFVRGQTHLLKNIHRRKPIHSHSSQGISSVPLSESEIREFEEEIESLNQENSLLRLELDRREQENRQYKFEFQSLESRLQNIDQRQRQVLALVAQLSLKPAFASDLTQTQHLEIHTKKRRSLVTNSLWAEQNLGDYQSAISQKDQGNTTSLSLLNLELVNKLDSSINVCENILNGISKTPGEEAYGFQTLPQASPVIVTDLQAPSGDSHPSSPSSQTDTPEISSFYNKPPGIDVITNTARTIDVDILKDRLEGRTSISVPNGVNDVFWQQFLTEEVESERGEIDIRNGRNA